MWSRPADGLTSPRARAQYFGAAKRGEGLANLRSERAHRGSADMPAPVCAKKTRTELEAYLVAEQVLSKDKEAQLAVRLTARLSEVMHLRFVFVDSMARGAGGKFEDFVYDVVDP